MHTTGCLLALSKVINSLEIRLKNAGKPTVHVGQTTDSKLDFTQELEEKRQNYVTPKACRIEEESNEIFFVFLGNVRYKKQLCAIFWVESL